MNPDGNEGSHWERRCDQRPRDCGKGYGSKNENCVKFPLAN